jgi:hypothetical protein
MPKSNIRADKRRNMEEMDKRRNRRRRGTGGRWTAVKGKMRMVEEKKE